MARHNELGKWGEQYAADYLQGLGYDIIEREVRFDIITIVGSNNDNAQLEHIIEAFNPCLAY